MFNHSIELSKMVYFYFCIWVKFPCLPTLFKININVLKRRNAMSEEMIRNIQSRIAEMYGEIAKNEEKIQRLEKAAHEIQQEQGFALENNHPIQKPIITTDIWNGKSANKATDIREQINDVYNDLFTWKVEDQLVSIEDKIQQLRSLNNSLYSNISSQQASLTYYRTQKN